MSGPEDPYLRAASESDRQTTLNIKFIRDKIPGLKAEAMIVLGKVESALLDDAAI